MCKALVSSEKNQKTVARHETDCKFQLSSFGFPIFLDPFFFVETFTVINKCINKGVIFYRSTSFFISVASRKDRTLKLVLNANEEVRNEIDDLKVC